METSIRTWIVCGLASLVITLSATFAFAKFSEHLRPGIKKYVRVLLR